jgi:hypothetical protein
MENIINKHYSFSDKSFQLMDVVEKGKFIPDIILSLNDEYDSLIGTYVYQFLRVVHRDVVHVVINKMEKNGYFDPMDSLYQLLDETAGNCKVLIVGLVFDKEKYEKIVARIAAHGEETRQMYEMITKQMTASSDGIPLYECDSSAKECQDKWDNTPPYPRELRIATVFYKDCKPDYHVEALPRYG